MKILGLDMGNDVIATTAETDARPGDPAGANNDGLFACKADGLARPRPTSPKTMVSWTSTASPTAALNDGRCSGWTCARRPRSHRETAPQATLPLRRLC